MKVYDYVCPSGHRHEHFIGAGETGPQVCKSCGAPAVRVLSAPRFALEGVTGSFPGAAMQWEKKRAEKMAVQARKQRDHGDDGWT